MQTEGEKEQSSLCWFTTQKATTAGPRLGHNQEHGTPFRSLTWAPRAQVTGPSSAAFPGTLAGSRSEAEPLGLQRALQHVTWASQRATTLTHEKSFIDKFLEDHLSVYQQRAA